MTSANSLLPMLPAWTRSSASSTTWKSYGRPRPSAIRCAEAISQGRTEAGISARLCRCAGGFNEQIFGADEQVPKVAAALVQKMHSGRGNSVEAMLLAAAV